MPERDIPDDENDVSAGSFWSGTITFGLVSVPVNLVAANRSQRVGLRMVGPDGTPLARRYFRPSDGKQLESDDIIRGYEIEKNKFVPVEDDELERLAPERTRDIDLRLFVDAEELDPVFFERAYYLTPAGGSTKAYRLLAKVMEDTGRAGIATFVMRAKEYLVAILAENGILRAETLRFEDEVRSPGDIGLPDASEPVTAEVRKITKAIEKLSERRFSEKELEDKSVDRLRSLVKKKLGKGEDVVRIEPAEDEGSGRDVIDLMEMLQRSLAGSGAAEPKPDGARKKSSAKAGSKATPAKATAAKKAAGSKSAGSKKSTPKKSAKTAPKKSSGKKTAASSR